MRINSVKCEMCDTTVPSVDPSMLRIMPQDWLVLVERQGYLGEKELHFCSKTCLVQWAEPTPFIIADINEAKKAHGVADRNFYIPWVLTTKLSKEKWFQMCRELQAITDRYMAEKESTEG